VIVEREKEITGAVGLSVMSIRPGDSAVAIGIGDLPIAASSHFINLMESAAIAAIGEFLEVEETTRILSIELEVLDVVAIGTEIRATATCTEYSGRELGFLCDIYAGDRHVAHARMKRAAVERVSFLARTAAQSLNSQGIEEKRIIS
jgi:fluoroacetyl-CoA thioesterase